MGRLHNEGHVTSFLAIAPPEVTARSSTKIISAELEITLEHEG